MNKERRNRKNPDSHRSVSAFAAVIFFAFIVIADLVLVFSHGRVFSENENRMLQQAPELSAGNLTSGRFMTQFEDFVADQFFLRDGWIGSKLRFDTFMGKKEEGGVYLAGDGYLIEATAEPNEAYINASMTAINEFASRNPGLNIVMSVVPNASQIYPELCPKGAFLRNQTEDIRRIREQAAETVQFVDVEEALWAHKEEQLYYRSDHHWTSLGARYAYEAIAPSFHIMTDGENYKVLTVADDFSGTMAAASGSFRTADSVEIHISDRTPAYYVEYAGDPARYGSVYHADALQQKNKYEVFLGGNHPKIRITSVNDTGRSLLVLKDSYANCLIPFLLPYFDHIVIIDPRYYSDELDADIASEKITDVLILYNANTFVQDNSLAGVLRPE